MPANSRSQPFAQPRVGGRLTRRDLLHALTAVAAGTAVGGSAYGFLYERHQSRSPGRR